MIIAQISDLHIAGPGKKTYGIAPMAENLGRTVDHVNGLRPRPDLVIVTGDIAMNGRQEEVELAVDLLNALQMPCYIVPGNHDDRETLWSVCSGRYCPERHDEFISYVIDDFPVRLLGLDSTVPGQPGGEICPRRAAWLDARLGEEPEKPTVLFMHHPPVKCGVLETDVDGFTGAERLGEIIGKYRNIEAVLCGHIHLPASVRWQGTVVSTAPSIGMELLLDLTMQLESAFYLADPGYQLHYWSPQNNLVTHTGYVQINEGPYPFADSPGGT